MEFYPIERKSTSFISNIKRAFFCKIKMFEKVYWEHYKFNSLLNKLRGKMFDLVISNDIESLPFALKIANGAKTLLDAHEYSPQEFEDRFLWKFFLQSYKKYLCDRYIGNSDKMITVSEGIANEYSKNFGVKPIVITNACEFANTKPSPTNKQNIKLIHHGVTVPSRKLEIMIEMMDFLDERFNLDIMLVNTNPGYFNYLKTLAKDKDKINFLEPVPMKKIVGFINPYDIGIFILPPTNLNYKYALPNKFFDFVQARLAPAIGPSPEMAKIVKQYDCGIVAENFAPETMAKELNKLTGDRIEYYKRQSDKAAQELSFEKNSEKFEDLVEGLLTNNHS